MTAYDFVDRLEKVRKSGRGWMARCPGHEDRNPSLAIKQVDEKILLNCFAGCSSEKIVAAMGLELKDLFDVPASTTEVTSQRRSAVRSYPVERDTKRYSREQSAPIALSPLPHSEEAERAILGHILLENNLIYEAEAALKMEDFYIPTNRMVYAAMVELAHEGSEINPVLIVDKLGKRDADKVGGIVRITILTNDLRPTKDLSGFIKILIEKSTRRKLFGYTELIQQSVFDDEEDSQSLITLLDSKLDLLRENSNVGFRSFADVAGDVAGKLDNLRNGINPAISSGLPLLDKAMKGGGQPGEFHIWAALTGGGKSALMKQMAQCIAGRGEPVGIVTAEMSDYEVFFRMLSPESGVPAWLVQHGISEQRLNQLDESVIGVANLPIWIDDHTTNIFEIRARVKALKRTQDIKVLFVDYLQLLEVQSGVSYGQMLSRAQEIATCSRTLKKLAKELDIWIVALAQFNRKANEKDEQGMTTPQLHHLAESGKLEQDSDLVGIIDLDDYVTGQPIRNAVLRIVKYRNGPGMPLKYKFNGDYLIFQEVNGPTILNRKDEKTKDMYSEEPTF